MEISDKQTLDEKLQELENEPVNSEFITRKTSHKKSATRNDDEVDQS
jgi:hypothetical protein